MLFELARPRSLFEMSVLLRVLGAVAKVIDLAVELEVSQHFLGRFQR